MIRVEDQGHKNRILPDPSALDYEICKGWGEPYVKDRDLSIEELFYKVDQGSVTDSEMVEYEQYHANRDRDWLIWQCLRRNKGYQADYIKAKEAQERYSNEIKRFSKQNIGSGEVYKGTFPFAFSDFPFSNHQLEINGIISTYDNYLKDYDGQEKNVMFLPPYEWLKNKYRIKYYGPKGGNYDVSLLSPVDGDSTRISFDELQAVKEFRYTRVEKDKEVSGEVNEMIGSWIGEEVSGLKQPHELLLSIDLRLVKNLKRTDDLMKDIQSILETNIQKIDQYSQYTKRQYKNKIDDHMNLLRIYDAVNLRKEYCKDIWEIVYGVSGPKRIDNKISDLIKGRNDGNRTPNGFIFYINNPYLYLEELR